MQYFNLVKKSKPSSQMISAPKPVLTAEDEAYFREVTSHPESAAKLDGDTREIKPESPLEESSQAPPSAQAENIPLPTSPVEEFGKELGEEGREERRESQPSLTRSETPKSEVSKAPQKKKRWSTMFWKKNTDKKVCQQLDRNHRIILVLASRTILTSNANK